MATGDIRIGLNGEFYYGTTGSTPSTEAENVDNVVLTISKRTAERIKRKKRYVTKKVTVTEATLTFDIVDEEGDAFLAAITTAAMADTSVALYALNVAAASGGEGLNADWYITEFTRNESNPEIITYNVSAVLTDEDRDPVWE
jgi:hypothetical protein